jgi:phosphoribosyl 1,2-cyclic phosphodiesterase
MMTNLTDTLLFCPLASSSKGNSTLLKTKNGSILIDAGLSFKQLDARLSLLHTSIDSIKGIVITHEHHDHIAGLKTLALKYGIPVLANYLTASAIARELHDCPHFKIFTTCEPFEFQGIEFFPFSVQHDGVDPVGFTMSLSGKKIGLCTDLGFATSLVRHSLQGCDIILVEANHKEEMVLSCNRPEIYKKRVLSRSGHLSNEDCLHLLLDVMHDNLKTVYLAHLSSECNHPEVALETIKEGFLNHGIHHASIFVAKQNSISHPTTL